MMISKLNRRAFIQVGALGSGLSLSQYLRVQASQKEKQNHRSAIFIFMEGAPEGKKWRGERDSVQLM